MPALFLLNMDNTGIIHNFSGTDQMVGGAFLVPPGGPYVFRVDFVEGALVSAGGVVPETGINYFTFGVSNSYTYGLTVDSPQARISAFGLGLEFAVP